MMTVLTIEAVAEHERDAFAALWIPWLRDTIGRAPEAEDLEIMADPGGYYRHYGGDAFLARIDGKLVGAVAVKSLGAAGFEFCKLVVGEDARGHGVGRKLVVRCVDHAADRGAPMLYLQSFRALDIALTMYRKMGFVDVAAPSTMTVLGRTEIIMAKPIATR